MTLFNFIKECLRRESARTEPNSARVIQAVFEAVKKGGNGERRPP